MFLTSKYNKIILSSLIFVLSFLMVAQAGLAVEEPGSTKALKGLETTGTTGFSTTEDKLWQGGPPAIIGKIVGTALAFLGVVFFVLIIMGGYMWMTSMGNEQSTTKAKDIIMAAVIGLFIVLIAYAATKLISGIFA